MIHIKDEFLEEKNFIQDYANTYFYIEIATNPICYGVAVNVKDKDKMQEIIKEFKIDKKEQMSFAFKISESIFWNTNNGRKRAVFLGSKRKLLLLKEY